MKKAILATKVGMTQIFNEDGVLTPVTVLQAGPCVVTQVKTVENDGYSAVQVGFTDKREKLVNKAQKGHFNKAGVSYKRDVREHRRLRLTSLPLAIRLTQPLFPRVKDSRVLSRDMVSTEDPWLTVPSSTVMLVPMVPAPIRARYSREKECLARWVTRRSPSRTLRLSA